MDRKLILERHNRVEKSLRQNEVDAVVLFNVEGIGWEDLYYFSGFRGTSGIFVFGQNEKFLITDSRYILQAREQSPFSVIDKGDKEDIFLVESMLRDLGAKTVGINTKALPSYLYLKLSGLGFTLVDVSDILASCRRKKSKEEVDLIKIAAEQASKAFLNVLNDLKPGIKETEVAAKLEYEMKILGAEGGWGSADFIVASGVRSALPHGRATSKEWQKGEWATIDFGARYEGYVSDITRNIYMGAPSRKAVEIHSILCMAHIKAASKIKPGVAAREVDMTARQVLADRGLDKYFTHSLGHGIGLEVHEIPRLSSKSADVLEEGDVVTVEPGVYIEGYGGMRVEDDYLVTDSGAQRLTADIPMELFVVMD